MRILKLILLSGALSLGLTSFAAAQMQTAPAPDANAPQNPAMKSPDDASQAPLAKGQNSFTKDEARDRLQKAGYSDVEGLTLDPDGLWQATAQKNGQSVHVALDYKGDVASQ